jgi:hypothetical protein
MKALDRLTELLHTRWALVLVAIGGISILLGLASSCNSSKRPTKSQVPATASVGSNYHVTVSRPSIPIAPTPIRSDSASRTNRPPILYSVHVEVPGDGNPPPALDAAPFGRFLQCQLVNTLESLAPNTPIVGLVVEDLWHNGKLVIPAGSEVHGQAQIDRVRERIASTGSWRIIFQTGEQLSVSGLALDREFNPNGSGWGMADGSAGIRGEILRSDSFAEAKLFLATALSGVSQGLQQTRSTIFGTQLRGTVRNAGLAGAGKVLDTYAEQVLEAVKRDGIYVRVPAGKQFYLYVTEPLERSKARFAISNVTTNR